MVQYFVDCKLRQRKAHLLIFASELTKQNMAQLEPSYIQILMKTVISPMPLSIRMGPVDIPQLFKGGLFRSSPNYPATRQPQDSLQNQALIVPTLKNISPPSHHFLYPSEMHRHSSRASTEASFAGRQSEKIGLVH